MNGYTLTKHMCEELLEELHSSSAYRTSFVRPTMIGPIAFEPLPGYFGNTGGMTATVLAFASGDLMNASHDFPFSSCLIANSSVPLVQRTGIALCKYGSSEPLLQHTGMARFTCHHPDHILDFIPCDLVATTVLVAACVAQEKVCPL